MNNYTDKKIKCLAHSATRFKQRYGDLTDDYDYEEIRKNLLDCIKSQTNIVYSHSQGKFKTEYIIFFSDYFRFVYAKDVAEIISFLPIHKEQKKIIKEFEDKTLKKLNEKYVKPSLKSHKSGFTDDYFSDWMRRFESKQGAAYFRKQEK